jgi:NAD(P)-dependent dehydrogenase (short-subunit alcohol dehydrogenase family)
MVEIEQLFRLDGKVPLVTGGYGGIGEAVCRGLAKSGAKVAIAGHNGSWAAALADALNSEGYSTRSAAFEATLVDETQRMVDAAAAHFGRLDILVNCIGLNREEKAEEVTEKMFDYVYAVNLKSAMFQLEDDVGHGGSDMVELRKFSVGRRDGV